MGLLSWLLTPIIDRRIAQFQNGLMATHIAEVEHIYNQMRGWRHDYHNHMQKLKAHLHLKQYGDIDAYLTALADDLAQVDVIIKTGNVAVDAILNSKVSVARAKGINVNAKAIVPTKLNVAEIDLCVIIGNLLDNAIEACAKQLDETERFIRVYVGTHKDLLYISVSNSVTGQIQKSGGRYFSTKASPSHGFGLIRIDKISQKYNGFVNRQNEEGIFATEVMLPL